MLLYMPGRLEENRRKRVRLPTATSQGHPSKLGRSLGKLNSALSPRLQNHSLDRIHVI